MKLSFDEVRHEYQLEGKPVPSVTKIISNINEDLMLSTPFIRKTAIGTQVHKICEMINNKERVNISALSEDIGRYVNGYIKFREAGKYIPNISELRVFSPKYRFAGTLDILAKDRKGNWALMDIKTSAIVSPTTALQLAAYKQCLEEMAAAGLLPGFPENLKIKERICIWLTGDDNYELIYYKDEGDWNIFMCHLVVHNWKRKVGLK